MNTKEMRTVCAWIIGVQKLGLDRCRLGSLFGRAVTVAIDDVYDCLVVCSNNLGRSDRDEVM